MKQQFFPVYESHNNEKEVFTMKRYIPEFEAHLAFLSLAPSSITETKRDLIILSNYLSSPVQQVTQADLEAAFFLLKEDRSIKEVTLNRKISSCRVFFNFLFKRGYLRENPAENLPSAKRIKGIPVHLSKEGIQKLLKASEGNFLHQTIIYAYYESGIRLSELINLQIPDVDSSSMKLRILGKGRKLRYLSFSQELLQRLRKIVKTPEGYRSKGYLFLQPDFTPLTPSYVQRMIRDYVIKAGIIKRVSPKTLRHTHGTHSLEAGINLFQLKKNLGHSDLSSTLLYTHLQDSSSSEAHEKFLAYAFN